MNTSTVQANLNLLAGIHNTNRVLDTGIFVEDKQSGTIVLQNMSRVPGSNVYSIDSKLTSIGKDERAFAASPYIHQNRVRFTDRAFEKTIAFKEMKERNHLLAQMAEFRIGDPEAQTRADDLVDCLCYGAILGLGQLTTGGAL